MSLNYKENRITEIELPNLMKQDGDVLYGRDINRLSTVLKGGVNLNASLIEGLIAGDNNIPFYYGDDDDWKNEDKIREVGEVYVVSSLFEDGDKGVKVEHFIYSGYFWESKGIVKIGGSELESSEVFYDSYVELHSDEPSFVPNGEKAVDGVDVKENDLVLISGTEKYNGIYKVKTGGNWIKVGEVKPLQSIGIADGSCYGGSIVKRQNNGLFKTVFISRNNNKWSVIK